jgi:hypothetical protein
MRNTIRSPRSSRAGSRWFSRAPAGILFPTDPGVPRTLAPAGNLDFAPRIGLAYGRPAPGSSGKTSVRASYGMFYTAIEALTIGISSANAPYGTTYTSPAPPLFATPFITAANGQNVGQYFPVQLAPLNTTASHPDASSTGRSSSPSAGCRTIDRQQDSLHRGIHALDRARLRQQHRAQRELCGHAGASSAGAEEANPGNPALCLQLSNPANLAPGQTPCGPFNESNVFTTASGQTIDGTRGPLGSNFGSDTMETTIGNSNYNSLQVTLRHTSGPLQLLAAYTYSKSLDQSSNLGEEVNPLNPSLSRALVRFRSSRRTSS